MCARLGADVTMVNAVGDDAFGTMTIDNLRPRGSMSGTSRGSRASSTGAAPILVEPDGTNRILIVPGRMPDGARRRRDRDRGAAAVDVVVGQLEIPQRVTAAAFRAARARGATTILNPAPAAEHRPAPARRDGLARAQRGRGRAPGRDARHPGGCADGSRHSWRRSRRRPGRALVVTLGARARSASVRMAA